MLSAQQIIELYNLKPLSEEGGFFTETYRSTEMLGKKSLPACYSREKSCGTAIFYLLTPDTCSALHRLPTDEIYHFYLGDPVVMPQLFPDGDSRIIRLGQNLTRGEQVQAVVPRGVWQGAVLDEGGHFALMGTTMAPGFDFDDFQPGEREQLVKLYPAMRDLIIRLTKPPAGS